MSKLLHRPQALFGDRPGSVRDRAPGVRMSPTKVRRVVDMIRGMDVEDALNTCRFSPQAARQCYKVSAAAERQPEAGGLLRLPAFWTRHPKQSAAGERSPQAVGRRGRRRRRTQIELAIRGQAAPHHEHGSKDQSVRLSPPHSH